ncbi:MAG TPA: hypothetical protein VGG91_12010, partial [Myxococcaceae bacterium]
LRRNAIYRFCGIAMILCLAWAGYEYTQHGPIFWPETLALVLFGWSWLTKGRAGWTLLAMERRARKKLGSARG